MALVEMVMPKMGESVMEGTVLNWLKSEGDSIEQDESLLEVATDKVDTEIPSLFAGTIKQLLVQEGDVVAIGNPIAIIETEEEVEDTETPTEMEVTPPTENIIPSEETAQPVGDTAPIEDDRFYSPLVLNIAKKEGINKAELQTVVGTGKDGRVTKHDMLKYVAQRGQGKTAAPTPATANGQAATPVAQTAKEPTKPVTAVKPAISLNGSETIIEMDRMRKMIAQRMLDSKRIAPHVTSFVEADMTNIVRWRGSIKKAFMEQYSTPITYTPILIAAVVKAIKDYPMMNSSVKDDKIIVHGDINIGMAVALSDGNLIVPVIKNADRLNITGITLKVNELAKKARNNKLTADDLSGGTYTISNVGTFGNVMGTPILVQPQVGIMAFGSVQKKPAVIETPEGDSIGIRNMMFLSHSYDHRIIDGSLGGMFVRRVADYLEQFDTKQGI